MKTLKEMTRTEKRDLSLEKWEDLVVEDAIARIKGYSDVQFKSFLKKRGVIFDREGRFADYRPVR